MKEKAILTIDIHGREFGLNSVEIATEDPSRFSELFNPDLRGHWRALFDICDMKQYSGDITLSPEAFTSPEQRIYFQKLINTYRQHIAKHFSDSQLLDAQREICRLNNEKRKIDLEPLIPEIEQFIRQYRRDNTGANIKEILNAVSEHLSAEKGISISVRTLRNKNIQALIRSIAEKEKSGKV